MNSLKKIIWVDPLTINYFQLPPHYWWYGRIQSYPIPVFLKEISDSTYNRLTENIWYSGSWDLKAEKFREKDWFVLINNLVQNKKDFKKSDWYHHAKKSIYSSGVFIHKKLYIKNLSELDIFFSEYLIPLIDSLSENGWDSKISDEIPTGMIGRDGSLIKSGYGCHRLAILQSVNNNFKYPMRIVAIHPKINTASDLPDYIIKLLKSINYPI